MSRLSLSLFALLISASGLLAQAPTKTTAIPDQTLNTGATPTTVDLKQHFGATGFPTTPVALFETVLGNFYVELLTSAAPKHVENFTAYANERLYDGVFFHRSSSLEAETTTGLPDNTKAAKVLQGGSFRVLPTGYGDSVRVGVPTKAAVALEYNQPNAKGTLAAARGNTADSATSGWFFNLVDNTTALGQTNGQGGYSVFGRVIGNGMTVVEALGALPRFRYSEGFSEFPLRDYTKEVGGPVRDANLALITRVRVVTTYPTDHVTPGLIRFEAASSDAAVVRPKIVGSTLELHPGKPGTATVTVNALDAENEAVNWAFIVTVNAPRITTPPASQTVAAGGSVTFEVAAEGTGPLTYQWRKNGTALAGATSASLSLSGLTAGDAGEYTVAVSQGAATTVSRAATLTVQAPVPSALANLSVRGNSSPSIIGFAVEGGSRQLLFRGIGPALESAFGLTGAIRNPKVEVIAKNSAGQDTLLASNDNWGAAAATLQPVFAQVGAFPLTDTNSNDAAVVATVGGVATAIVDRANNFDGISLAEIYDLAPGQGGRLVNLSSRSWVDTGDNVVIVGFVISGNEPRRVLIRAVGPTLGSAFNFTGALSDPILEVHKLGTPNVLIARNDDWSTEPQVATAGVGFPLPDGSADAAVVLTLPAGSYTATVRGHPGLFGVALVELYDLE